MRTISTLLSPLKTISVLALVLSALLLASASAEYGEDTMIRHPGYHFHQGPSKATGVIVWSPGTDVKTFSHPDAETGYTPHILDWLYGHGWDVFFMERADLIRVRDRGRHAQALERAVAGLKAAGYSKVVLGSQSAGGIYSMMAAEDDLGLHALVLAASGPTVGEISFTDMLKKVKADRIAVFHFTDDTVIGKRNANAIDFALDSLPGPGMNVFNPDGITGHGGFFLSEFSYRFGDCLLEFLDPEVTPNGRECAGK